MYCNAGFESLLRYKSITEISIQNSASQLKTLYNPVKLLDRNPNYYQSLQWLYTLLRGYHGGSG
jgi:hypothetical protein